MVRSGVAGFSTEHCRYFFFSPAFSRFDFAVFSAGWFAAPLFSSQLSTVPAGIRHILAFVRLISVQQRPAAGLHIRVATAAANLKLVPGTWDHYAWPKI